MSLERKMSLDFDFLNLEMLAPKTKRNMGLEFRFVPYRQSPDAHLRNKDIYEAHYKRGIPCA